MLKRKRIILVLVIVLLLSQVGYINAQVPALYVANGNFYLEELSENERILYIYGLFDMWTYMYRHHFPDNYKKLYEEIENMTMGQIEKIFEKYLEEHPEKSHYTAASLFDVAMDELLTGAQ